MSSLRRLGKVVESLSLEAVPLSWLVDENNNLQVHGAVLAVGFYCAHLTNVVKRNGQFEFDVQKAVEATGYSERAVWKAFRILQGLEPDEKKAHRQKKVVEKPDLSRVHKNKLIVRVTDSNALPNTFSIINPDTGYPLGMRYADNEPQTLRSMMSAARLHYQNIPTYVMQNLRTFKGESLAAVVTLFRLLEAHNVAMFDVVLRHWKEMSKISRNELLERAWSSESFKKLLLVKHKPEAQTARVEAFNPKTGESLKEVQSEAIDRAKERKALMSVTFSDGTQTRNDFMEFELVEWFRYEFPLAVLRNGEWVINCPGCGKNNLRFRFDTGVGFFNCRANICRSRGEKVKCKYPTQGRVAYHFVAEHLGIEPKEAYLRMERFIMRQRQRREDIATRNNEASQ